MRIKRSSHHHLPWEIVALYFLASLSSCTAQTCIGLETTLHINVVGSEASFVSLDDIPWSPANCMSSMEWVFGNTDGAGSWISIDILEFYSAPNATGSFALRFAPDSGADWLPVSQGLHRRGFVRADQEPRLQLNYVVVTEEHFSDSYRFRARISLTNETDCEGDFQCDEQLYTVCLDPKVICDNQVQCMTLTGAPDDETNCDECGETNIDLMIGQAVGIVTPQLQTTRACKWRFNAPRMSRVLVRFSDYRSHVNAVFLVATLERFELLDMTPWNVFLYRKETAFSSAPRVITIRNSTVWIGFANVDSVPFQGNVTVHFEVSAVNETFECTEEEFLCDTGVQCVASDLRCDGLPDCEDHSDEFNCSDACGPGELTCKVNSAETCLEKMFLCDSNKECDDFQDEMGCASSCGDQSIHLQPNTVHSLASPNAPGAYPLKTICVWFVKAPPGTRILIYAIDINLNAGTTLSIGEGARVDLDRVIWQRQSGTAPLASRSEGDEIWVALHDGIVIDLFNSDPLITVEDAHFTLEMSVLEDFVECTEDEFLCDTGVQCIASDLRCNGLPDCEDHSDEFNCSDACGPSELTCMLDYDEICIGKKRQCDGSKDCDDFQDEIVCAPSCGDRSIYLQPNTTHSLASPNAPASYPLKTICVWFVKAPPGSRILIHTVRISLNAGTTLAVGEGARVDLGHVVWQRQGGTAPLASVSEGYEIWVALHDESFIDAANPPPVYGLRDAHFILELSVLENTVNCSGAEQFACHSGYQCVESTDVCNGVIDCWDYSDELSCDDACDNYTIACTNPDGEDVCLYQEQFCSGRTDCGDYRDETLCASFCGDRYINLEDYPDSRYDIVSPEGGYPPLIDCLWIVKAAPGRRIHFELKHQANYEEDFLVLGDGTDPFDLSTELGYAGGPFRPFSLLSSGDTMWVTFTAPILEESGGHFWYQLRTFDSSVQCDNSSFQCPTSGLCIDAEKVCDGVFTCDDNFDEMGCDHCGGVSVINVTDNQPYTLQIVYELDEVNFPYGRSCLWQVFASPGHRIKVTFKDIFTEERNNLHFGNGEVQSDNAFASTLHSSQSRLFVSSEENEMWIVLVSEVNSDDRFTLEIEQYEPVECREDQFTCLSGLACIALHQVCDGTPQCPDLQDEFGCGSCSSDQFTCSDSSCVDGVEGICNANGDCSDLGDERNCFPCGESDILLSNGTSSPFTLALVNYPQEYSNNLQCFWFVTADVDSVVTFRFLLFDLEQRYDTLTIGSGHDPSDSNSVIVHLTGSLPSVQVLSMRHMAWLGLVTDYSITAPGFSVMIAQEAPGGSCSSLEEFTCSDSSLALTCLAADSVCDGFAVCLDGSDEKSCGECGPRDIYIYDETVTLTSPHYPAPYPDDLSCTWRIIAELDTRIVMRIVDFALEDYFDFLTISLGEVPSGPGSRELLRLTGEDITRRTLTWDSEYDAWLTMTSDLSAALRGFSVTIAHVQNITDYHELCDSDEFHCGTGACVEEQAVCNGFWDCPRAEDEMECDHVFCPGSYQCDTFTFPSSSSSPLYTQPSSPLSSQSSSSMPVVTTHSTPNPLGISLGSSSPAYPSSSSSSFSSSSFSSSTSSSSSSIVFDPDLWQIPTQCIPRTQVCNGLQDCPGSDDETECDTKRCPVGCQCSYSGNSFIVACPNGWNDATLSDLALTTHTLKLSGANVSVLERGTFKGVSHLKVLSLEGNNLSEINRRTFDGLGGLLWLDLSNTSLTELKESALEELSSLRGITIFDVPLERIKTGAFAGLGNMETLILVRNIKGIPRLKVDKNAFDGIDNVSTLYVDDHRLCCFFPDTVTCQTLEPEPPLFMCSELMPNIILKVFMWILGISALVGNIFVMVWRCREKTEGRASRIVHSFLVFNLAVSDALMGLYMLLIAGADVYFGDRYFESSMEWRSSIPCQLAGFISIIASEASVFFLTLISIDRFLSIVFPFSSHHLRPKSAKISACCVWIGTVVVALVPTILALDPASDVYGLSDVCIGLPLMTKVTHYETTQQTIDAGGVTNITVGIPVPVDTRASWFFSIALFLGVNLLCFTVILACYIAVFVSVKLSMKRVRRHKKRDDEIRLAIKMAAIVMTDFVCWIPVIVMGILSQARIVEIPTETYAWIVVFILPINSSLNPYLYTISDLCSQQRREASTRKSDVPMRNSNSENRISMVNTLTTEAGSKYDP